MKGKRKHPTAAFKTPVALAAVKGDTTVNELAGRDGVHPTLLHACKQQLLVGAEQVFASGARTDAADTQAQKAELFEQIGRLKMELEGLKKSRPLRLSASARCSRPATRG
jgi:putative transposase